MSEIKTSGIKPKPFSYDPPKQPLNIIHQDDDLLVLSKPSGLLSVPGRSEEIQDSLQTRAKKEFPECLLVHRLDMETSGLFLMARNSPAQKNLGLQFEQRKTEKTYIARVWGQVEDEAGEVDLPLRCDWENRPIQMVCYEHGKPAQTKWEVLGRETRPSLRASAKQSTYCRVEAKSSPRNDGYNVTRLKLTPLTGRSHQLRVHMLSIGHPILGDEFYAHDAALKAAPRLQLHAESLTVTHPATGKRITFTDPCPF